MFGQTAWWNWSCLYCGTYKVYSNKTAWTLNLALKEKDVTYSAFKKIKFGEFSSMTGSRSSYSSRKWFWSMKSNNYQSLKVFPSWCVWRKKPITGLSKSPTSSRTNVRGSLSVLQRETEELPMGIDSTLTYASFQCQVEICSKNAEYFKKCPRHHRRQNTEEPSVLFFRSLKEAVCKMEILKRLSLDRSNPFSKWLSVRLLNWDQFDRCVIP